MKKFDPLKSDHWLVTNCTLCPVCSLPFEAGDEVTLTPTWPADKEEARKAQQGLAYNSVAKPIHWDCRGTPDG